MTPEDAASLATMGPLLAGIAGNLGTGPRARIEKDRTTGRWMCAVAIDQGHAYGEFDTFDQALAGRYALIAELIERPPPVRGEAMDGPRGRHPIETAP